MAISIVPYSVKVAVLLNNGSTTTGAIKTVSLSIGKLSVSSYNTNNGDTLAMNVVNALSNVLDRSIYSVNRTKVDVMNQE